MSLATELEHQTMAAMHSMHGNTEEEEATVESLRAEVDRLREELATQRTSAPSRTDSCSTCASLQQAVGSLQAQLDAALEETKASRHRERTMSQDIAVLVQQSSATSAPSLEAASGTDVQAKVDETVKKILAESYEQMRETFSPASSSFSEDQCAHILASIKGVIRGVLQSMAPQLATPTPR